MLLSNLLSTKSIAGTFASAGEIICQSCFGFLFNKLCCPLSYFALFHQTIRNQMFYFFFFLFANLWIRTEGILQTAAFLEVVHGAVGTFYFFFLNEGNVIWVVLILISKLTLFEF